MNVPVHSPLQRTDAPMRRCGASPAIYRNLVPHRRGDLARPARPRLGSGLVTDQVVVRPARPDEAESVGAVLALAFADYTWTDWAVPPDEHGARLRTLYAGFAELTGTVGGCWLAETPDAVVAAAQWIPPELAALPDALTGRVRHAERAALGDRLEANLAAEAACRPLRPRQRHWFLASVGTVPGARGHGIAARLLRPVLDRCDQEATPAALETSSEANLRLYRRLGFTVSAELDPPAGAPHVWSMSRSPDPAGARSSAAGCPPREEPTCDV